MIFRWSIWGVHKEKNIELLKYGIRSFKYFFGNNHEYYVYTDDVTSLNKEISSIALVRNFNENGYSIFNINSKATWMKWCPSSRINIEETEVYADSDVFLLKYPKEIDNFINDPKLKFCIMNEFNGQTWQHGAMKRKADSDTPFVNAGFFVQKAGYDISPDLIKEFEWWKRNIKISEQTHHDEQGALAIALTKYLKNKELCILPKDKYILIGENENTEIKNLSEITLLHAVYPDHPAFYKFKDYIDKVIS